MKMKLFAGLLASMVASAALAQVPFSIFYPGPSGPVKSNGTYALQAEVSADIIGLWTGTCNATTFLKGAGACGQVNLATDVTGQLTVPNGGTGVATLTGLALGNGTSAFTPYGGNGCTNQFIRSLSSAGVATCNSVSLTADVTGTLGATNGGTSFNTYTLGDLLYSSAANTLAKLAGNTTTTQLFLSQTGNGAASAAPTWSALPGSFTGFANPTGTIGLAAVNGAATTALRSDSAPPLSQAIVPTWTGSHGFNGAYVTSAATTLTSPGQQGITFINSTSGANAKIWDILDSTANHLTFRAVNDAFGSAGNWLDVTRSGLSISSLSFGNSTDNPSYSFLGTGRTSFGGAYGGGTTPIVGASAATSNFYGEFDGTHEALFGTFASGGFVGTFSNHEFDFRTNNLARGVIDANGHWTLSAPAVGGQTAFTFNARTGNNAMLITQQAGAGAAFGLVVQAGTNSSDYNMLLQSQSGSTLFELFGDGGAVVGSPTGGDQGAGTINATGLFVNGSAITACSSGTWSATPGGFSAVASQTFKWSKCGNLVTVIIPAFTGTSNSTGLSVGSVPATIQPASAVSAVCPGMEDNGVLFLEGTAIPSGPSIGFSLWAVVGSHVQESSIGWTSVGTKGFNQGCSFTYSVQ